MEEVREGFKVVHEPSAPTVPTADIIFVHGLGGDPQKTWTSTAERYPRAPEQQAPANISTAWSRSWAWGFHRQPSEEPPPSNNPEPLFWPKDFLAVDVPEARILTYGYDSAVTKGYASSSKSGIFALSRNLLYKLEREREGGRPIIFIAHSLGGIITKEVLRRSESAEEQEIQDIVKSTKAVIFFGTPHRGSPGFAELGAIVRRVAEKTLRVDTNSSILRALGVDQPELEEGRISFTKQWRKFDFLVKTFQEDYGLSGINVGLSNEKVVPDTSSFLDDEREHAETIPANHIEMCKFSSRQDPGYKAVCAEIRRVLRRLDRQGPQFTKEETESFLKSLHFSTMYDRTMDVAEALKDTCEWVFTLPECQYWMDGGGSNDDSNLLWIKGKPGAGKSTLMKYIFQRMPLSAGHGSTTVASFFFNGKATDSLERTQIGLYRSILHQILRIDPTALCRSIPGYLNKKRTEKLVSDEVRWHREELQKLLFQSYADPGPFPAFILVDALDECSRDEIRDVIKFFRGLIETAAQAGNSMKVCFSSRHYPDLGIPCLEIYVDQNNSEDIFRYVQHQAEEINAVQELQEDLVMKASNIFLWVVLAIRILDRRGHGQSVKARRRLLARLPPELSMLFKDLFADLEDDERPQVLLLFQWILFAARPLTLAQITYAICFGSKIPPKSLAQLKESENYVAEEKRGERITALSRGLVELTKAPVYGSDPKTPRVQLIHESVRDFFLHERGFASLFPSNVPITEVIGTAHSVIARSCANSLLVPEVSIAISRPIPGLSIGLRKPSTSTHPLETYAFDEVLGHADTAEESGVSQTNTLRELRDQLDCVPTRFRTGLLHQACRRGLLSCASKLIELGADVNAADGRGLTPLKYACTDERAKDASIVLLLLQNGANPNHVGRDRESPLMSTSRDDAKLQATEALLNYGADPNSVPSFHGVTALWKADKLSAERLVRAGALVNWKNQRGCTVLHETTSIERLNLLLSLGADATATDSQGATPMHYADDTYQVIERMEILKRCGANPNAQDIRGNTPLHFCVSNISLLPSMAVIRAGASPNIRNRYGESILSTAFSTLKYPGWLLRALIMCCIVIAAGADPLSKDGNGKSPVDIWEEMKVELQMRHGPEEHLSPEDIDIVTRAIERGHCPELLDAITSLPEEDLYSRRSRVESSWWRVVCSFYAVRNE